MSVAVYLETVILNSQLSVAVYPVTVILNSQKYIAAYLETVILNSHLSVAVYPETVVLNSHLSVAVYPETVVLNSQLSVAVYPESLCGPSSCGRCLRGERVVWKRVLFRALFCPARLHRVPVELPSDACVLSTACCLSASRVGRKGGGGAREQTPDRG